MFVLYRDFKSRKILSIQKYCYCIGRSSMKLAHGLISNDIYIII